MSDPEADAADAQLLDDVRNSPEGPHIGAFFDFDGTVIAGYSVTAFMRHHVRNLDVRPGTTLRTLLAGAQGMETEEDFR
ncbi:MAG: hypothetical protein JOZ82_10505, partial [Marmoricola sp.]|nr:hypothetical protein [Marmoricola sp.]